MSAKEFSYNAPFGGTLRHLTIRQLRSLAALAAKGSVTAAASQLGLTQPAVTLQLRQLQDLAGLPLLQRTGDGMLLTEAGKRGAGARRAHRGRDHRLPGLARPACGPDRRHGHRRRGLDRKIFRAASRSRHSRSGYPKIELKLTIGNREEIREALHGYDLDFAIMGRPPADVSVDVRQLGRQSARHRRAHGALAGAGFRPQPDRPRARDLPHPRARLGHARR